MTNWDARDISIPLDFLDANNYIITVCKDGVNTDYYASDYTLNDEVVNKDKTMNIYMAPGGGFFDTVSAAAVACLLLIYKQKPEQ